MFLDVSSTFATKVDLSALDADRLRLVFVHFHVVHRSSALSAQLSVLLDVETHRQLFGRRSDLFRRFELRRNENFNGVGRVRRNDLCDQSFLLRSHRTLDQFRSVRLANVFRLGFRFVFRLSEFHHFTDDFQMVAGQ